MPRANLAPIGLVVRPPGRVVLTPTPPIADRPPMSFDDPIFVAATPGAVGQVLNIGSALADKSYANENNGAPIIIMLGSNMISRCRFGLPTREGPRIAGLGTFLFDQCWIECDGNDAAGDHADCIQAYSPGDSGTLFLNNSTVRGYRGGDGPIGAGSVGVFLADNWTGTFKCRNVIFWSGNFGCRAFPDTGGDMHIDFEDVFFVGPFQNDAFSIGQSIGGHVTVIDRWVNVRDATIVGGQLVPGALIPAPIPDPLPPLPPTGFPDATNTGFLNAPGYPGNLAPGGAVVSGNTYNFLDYADGLGLTGVSNVTFNGCRFQSNDVGFANIILVNCTNIVFNYCSIVPLVSLHPTPTHPGTWPSAGAGQPAAGLTPIEYAFYMIDGDGGYQYGVRIGGTTGTAGTIIDHCDIWGFGNAVDFVGALDGIVRDTWIHDAANPDPQGYHTDGPGYLDGGGGRSNILIEHCTIATLGNTNAIAFQAAGSPYSNITVQGCFLSGFGYTVDMCHNVGGNSSLTFLDNIFGTDIRWGFGPVYADFTAQFAQATNRWHNNKLRMLAGTSPAAGSQPVWTPANDGQFVWPDGTYHAADFES